MEYRAKFWQAGKWRMENREATCQILGKETATWFVIKDLKFTPCADKQGSVGGHVAPPETSLNAQQGADSRVYFYTVLLLTVS